MLTFLLTQLHILLAHKTFALISALLICFVLGGHGEGRKAEEGFWKAARDAAPEVAGALVRETDEVAAAEASYPKLQSLFHGFSEFLFREDAAAFGERIIPKMPADPQFKFRISRVESPWSTTGDLQSPILDRWGKPYTIETPAPKKCIPIIDGKIPVEGCIGSFYIKFDIPVIPRPSTVLKSSSGAVLGADVADVLDKLQQSKSVNQPAHSRARE